MKRLLLLSCVLFSSQALAQLAGVEELDNPGTVSAVQERKYRLNHELVLGVGVLPLDAFYKGFNATVAYTYHFTDHFAWQVGRGAYSFWNMDTGLREQLERDFEVLPTAFEEVQWMVGSDVVWSPFYGKSAFMNQKVFHFDAFVLAGASVIKFTRNFRPALNLGVGGRFFATQWLSARLELTNNFVLTKGNAVGALELKNVPTLQISGALNFGATE